jgi:hypothetical protein
VRSFADTLDAGKPTRTPNWSTDRSFDCWGRTRSFMSLTLIVSDTGHVFEMISNSGAPKTTAAILVGFFASILAVGAALTGLILTAIEES